MWTNLRQRLILRVKIWVQPELRELGDARSQNKVLMQANKDLNERVNQLTEDLTTVRLDLDKERNTTRMQSEVITRMEQAQKEMGKSMRKAEKMIEALTDRLVRLEAERGRWLEMPTDETPNA